MDIYSTEETHIGTWIDGKPLYRRTIKKVGTTNNSGNVLFNFKDYNIDLLLDVKGCLNQTAPSVSQTGYPWVLINTTYTSGSSTIVFYSFARGQTDGTTDNRTFRISYSGLAGNSTDKTVYIYVTIEYTKTTD